ncbi:hypothetical protein GH714_030116 [Hevea brasiliensis]|uniref:Uncharacterized protein n=1 Tax=Hevea brasiliensis TaxID=3981 RepID=A0A6A6MQK2_HEVBR|nr:hypothetical protein GH714_030116 [Hevea brasiliensis]
MASPSPSPQRNITVAEHSCTSTDSRIKSSPGDKVAPDQGQSVDDEHEKWSIIKKRCPESNVKSEETLRETSSVPSARMVEKTSNGGGKETWEEKPRGKLNAGGPSDANEDSCNSFETEDKFNVLGVVGTEAVVGSSPYPSSEIDSENKKNVNDELNIPGQAEQKPPAMMHSLSTKASAGEVLHPSDSNKDIISENIHEVKAEKADETDTRSPCAGKQKTEE